MGAAGGKKAIRGMKPEHYKLDWENSNNSEPKNKVDGTSLRDAFRALSKVFNKAKK